MFNKECFDNYDQILYIPSFKNGSTLFIYKIFGLLCDEQRKVPDLIIADELDTEFMLECFKNKKINNFDIKNIEYIEKLDVPSENKDYGNVYQMIINVADDEIPLIIILSNNKETFKKFIYKYEINVKVCCWHVDDKIQKNELKAIYLNEYKSFGCESFCVSCLDRENIFNYNEHFVFSSSYWDEDTDRYWWLYNYADNAESIEEIANSIEFS